MKIIVDKEKLDGNYSVELRLLDKESDEFKEAVLRNGAPKTELGGAFFEIVDGEEVEVFKLVSKVVEITKDLPYTRIFKVTQYGENAEKFANIYAIEAKKRLDADLDKIKVPDNFSDEDLEVIF